MSKPKKLSNESGYLIRIPFDPYEPIQIIENGYTVISDLHVIEITMMEYFRRGVEHRREALFNSPEKIVKHPMMNIEKAERVEMPEEEKSDGNLLQFRAD